MTLSPTARVWTFLGLGVAGAALGVWLVILWLPGWLVAARPTAPIDGATAAATAGSGSPGEADAPPGDTRRIAATLFYVSDAGDSLIPVEREVAYAAAPADQARRIVERQLAAAPAGRVSAIPQGTTLRSLFLTGRGEAFVDVSGAIVTAHPGGSLHESLTVYAIVNALTVNLPDITAVQILVDGREVDTLVGHLDLRRPLGRATRWVQRTP